MALITSQVPQIIANQRLAQPVTAFQQGQQAAQQSRLAQLKIQKAEEDLKGGSQMKPYGSAEDMLNDVHEAASSISSIYDRTLEQTGDEQAALNAANNLYQQSRAFIVGKGANPTLFPEQMDIGAIKSFITPPDLKSAEVQSSKILPGGLSQITMKDGRVKLVRLSDSDIESVKAAEERGAELQGLRAGKRRGATEAQKIASKAFVQLGNVKSNIRNLDGVIKLIDEGADTGVIMSKLPSVKSASIRLNQLRNELGLDVIGSVTFGALSEGELNLALNTGLPTNLPPAELKKWAQDKKTAQEKMVKYLDEQIQFLRGGNTVADWLEHKSGSGESVETPKSDVSVSGW